MKVKDCSILVIEEKNELTKRLKREMYQRIICSFSKENILKIIEETDINIVFLDIMTSGIDSLEMIDRIHRINTKLVIIIIVPHGDHTLVVDSMNRGAYAHLCSPVDLVELELLTQRALQMQELIEFNRKLQLDIKKEYSINNILGISRSMQIIYEKINKVAITNATVLIQGESGTGKALVARAIHYNSDRANNPLIEINCGSLPETLLENELFGHEKGAFTGATDLMKGRFELAHAGTIFLDEIGEIPLSSQVKLLRVIQEREIVRLGGKRAIKVDVRIIAATNKNLESEMKKGNFREDLYYRLNVVPLFTSPLRERKEDIPILVDHFLRKFSLEHKKTIQGITQGAMDRLLNYSWPGNVRELENVMERVLIMGEEGIIMHEYLPLSVQSTTLKEGSSNTQMISEDLSLSENIAIIEKYLIEKALKKTKGNKTKAAKILGVSQRGFRYKLRRYDLN
ncbi:MAG: sigma-54 dependent transcriptional regulator [bacterium]|nr:sigma-54 dependent transcriptional regulator [bacterium]